MTKFAYLRELLDFKVRKTVEALPHSAEGYNRAVSILKDRFGKESEIVKAYVKEIIELPFCKLCPVYKGLQLIELSLNQ